MSQAPRKETEQPKKPKGKVSLKGKMKFAAEKGKALPIMVGKKLVKIKEKAVEIDCDQLTLPAKSILRSAIADQDVKEIK